MDAKVISTLLYGIALFCNAALFIPQAWRIFKRKSAEETDLITFFGFNLIQLFGFFDRVYHQDYALIVGQGVSFLACGLVTVQLLFYKMNKFKIEGEASERMRSLNCVFIR